MANENKRDYYEVLGISKDATEADIKKAYRKMAAKYHPDVNHESDAEERFKEINEANEILSDPDKRSKYDQFGFAGVDPNFNPNMGGFGGGFGGGGFSGFGGFGDLGDIFGNIFGGGRSQRNPNAPARGEDVTTRIEITFEEAAFGTEKTVSASRIETCDRCSGTCAEPGTKVETCNRCRGRGTVMGKQNFMGMVMESETTCPDCRGAGKKIPSPCQRCKGKGRVRRSFSYKIKVPRGIDNEQTLRVPGEGCSGTNGGSAGIILGPIWNSNSRPPEGKEGLYRKDLDKTAGKCFLRYDGDELQIVAPKLVLAGAKSHDWDELLARIEKLERHTHTDSYGGTTSGPN